MALPDPVGMELEDDIAVCDALAGLEVADPVMEQVGADQGQLSLSALSDHVLEAARPAVPTDMGDNLVPIHLMTQERWYEISVP